MLLLLLLLQLLVVVVVVNAGDHADAGQSFRKSECEAENRQLH